MKKEIENLLASSNATLKLNQFAYLHRWQKDALGNRVDRLTVCVSLIAKPHDFCCEINSRDCAGIIREASVAVAMGFGQVAGKLATEMENGYIDGTLIEED